MRRFLVSVLGILAVLFLILLAGPHLPRSAHPRFESLTSEIDRHSKIEDYLSSSESNFDIKQGLEKTILRVSPKNTKESLVYFHGFSASPKDTDPLLPQLSTRLKGNSFLQRLKGHGLRNSNGLADASHLDWLRDAEEAYQIGIRLGDKISAIGISTGAILAIHLALKHQTEGKMNSLILLSPNFMPTAFGVKYLTGPLGPLWAFIFAGHRRSFPVENEMHGYVWTTDYPSRALVSLMDLVNDLQTWPLETIKVPTLCIYTTADSVIDVNAMRTGCSRIKAKIIELDSRFRHELVGNALHLPLTPVIDDIEDFASSREVH